jgi:hypothetical protein
MAGANYAIVAIAFAMHTMAAAASTMYAIAFATVNSFY